MHELSIAMSLIDLACEEAHRLGDVRVIALHVRIGPLSGVVTDALTFSFALAVNGTAIDGAHLVIEPVAVTAYCPSCAAEQPIATAQHLRCPVCGASTPDVLHGRELELAALEIEDLQTSPLDHPEIPEAEAHVATHR